MNKSIKDLLIEETFANLPKNFKKALVHWQYGHTKKLFPWKDENQPKITDWTDDSIVDPIIEEFNDIHRDLKLQYGMIPTELIKAQMTPISFGRMIDESIDESLTYSDFPGIEEYFAKRFNRPSHFANNDKNENWPIITQTDASPWIIDGHHRLNYYMQQKKTVIPMLLYDYAIAPWY